MDWLGFIASLVGGIAWPALVLALAILFRHELRPLLTRPIHRAKAGPVEIEWEKRVGEARVDLAKSPEAAEQPATDLHPRLSMSALAPRAAVLTAFAEVEKDLRDTLEVAHVDIGAPGQQGMRQIVDQAVAARVISQPTAQAIRGLIVLRNLAAHGGGEDIDPEKAEEFVALAESVKYALEAARRDQDEPPSAVSSRA